MSDSAKAKTFDTHPDNPALAESPFVLSYKHVGRPESRLPAGVTLHERPMLGHLVLRGGAIALDGALRNAINLSLPGEPLTMTQDSSGNYSAQWLSPDEWLLIVPPGEEFAVENKLREALGDAHYAITNVSGGQTLLELTGKDVRNLLMKSVIYDVDDKSFPVGKGVITVFAKTTVNIRRPAADVWQLVVRRSFADYSYRWLLDAGREYHIAVNV
ncbi:sarcosine oxidase subunit gamma [Pantoea sp. Acro-835]|uniref:Sarcosine oxidase subunit gamma n=2 Tax=Erwiniaceae TaxID=1903409 RepID=A0ABX0R4S2_9GAMM|nr:sarcosine oxidase subunit gamma [Pantoea multigeneris]